MKSQQAKIASQFINDSICKKIELEKDHLRKSYLEAKKDRGQVEAAKEWAEIATDTSGEW